MTTAILASVVVHSKADGYFGGREVKERDGELSVFGRVEEDADIAVCVETSCDAGAGRAFDAQALGADGDAAVGADFGTGALAPDAGPPGAFWSGAQGGALFLQRQVPCGLRGGAQFAVTFFLVVVIAKFFEQRVGLGQGGDVLGGEERREALLPKIMSAFDLAFGLRGGRVTQPRKLSG